MPAGISPITRGWPIFSIKRPTRRETRMINPICAIRVARLGAPLTGVGCAGAAGTAACCPTPRIVIRMASGTPTTAA
jgi:hypothetical protein